MANLGPAEHGLLAHEAWLANAGAVALMLELGFDPASRSPNGGTALHCAAWMGSSECVAIVLKYPAGRALVDTRDPTFGATPLGWCTHGSRNNGRQGADYAGVARLLIEAGARIEPSMADENLPEELHAVIDEALQNGRR
jgi:ankyrin repeat protein